MQDRSHALTRRQRRLARNRRWHIVLGGLVGLVALVAAALVLTDTVRLPDERPVLADRAIDRADATLPAPAGEPAQPGRLLTPDDPLRLWIAGDSLAGSIGPALGAMTAETGVVQPVFDSRISSGLNSPEFFDWPEHAAEQLAELDPEAVVFVIGANDAKVLPSGDGWQDDYAQKVDEMMALLVGNGRKVYWVSTPPMKDSAYSQRVEKVNEVFVEVAARYPDAMVVVDTFPVLTVDGETYSSTVQVDSGEYLTVRADDGVHFSVDGGDVVSEEIFTALDADWRITEQAVPDQAKQVIQTPGSSQIAGTYRPSSSGSSSGSSSSSGSGSGSATPSTTATTTPASTSPSTPTTSTSPPEVPPPDPPADPEPPEGDAEGA